MSHFSRVLPLPASGPPGKLLWDEGVEMTNWIETIIFLPPMAELGRVCDSLVWAPVPQSIHVSGPAPPTPTLGFTVCAFIQGIQTLRVSGERSPSLPTRLRHSRSWGPYFTGLESLGAHEEAFERVSSQKREGSMRLEGRGL